jgi:membrane protein DedA with SNARE-associated domain
VQAVFVLGLAFKLHQHFHGPSIDYATLALAAVASWAGVPGPGEPVLIAAGLLAAHHKLDLGEVLLVAWVAATAGGIVGWLVGMKAGRAVMTTRGPLHNFRRRALARGDEVFGRFPRTGVLLTPSWIAGIHHVRPATFLVWNAIGALAWTLIIGVGAYLLGPPIVDLVGDLGLVAAAGIVFLIGAGVWFEVQRRRRSATAASPPS